MLSDDSAEKYYISKDNEGISDSLQGRNLDKFDPRTAIAEGFYLPAVAEALENVAATEARAKEAEAKAGALREELQEIMTPVVLTEGRTDAKILLKAWEKRRGGSPPFAVRSCETQGELSDGGNGGAQMLALRLRAVPKDHPHVVIGIFDYDKEGIDAFKLDKNFDEGHIGNHKIKRGKSGKSYATFLPSPNFRKECEEYGNLPIEFLFRDEHLLTVVNGKSLKLQRKKVSIPLGTKKIDMELDNHTHFKEIKSGKTDFSNVIAPTLPSNAFDAFDEVFEIIENLIKHEQQNIDLFS